VLDFQFALTNLKLWISIGMQIRHQPGCDVFADGSIIARCGVQSNCAGIAQIYFRIDPLETPEIQFVLLDDFAYEHNEIVGGKDVPDHLRSALFSGVTEAYLQFSFKIGIKFTLIYAFVHPIDATSMMFKHLGKIATISWDLSRSNPNKTAWTMNELSEVYSNIFSSPDDEI
jgi:hypothetical protein